MGHGRSECLVVRWSRDKKGIRPASRNPALSRSRQRNGLVPAWRHPARGWRHAKWMCRQRKWSRWRHRFHLAFANFKSSSADASLDVRIFPLDSRGPALRLKRMETEFSIRKWIPLMVHHSVPRGVTRALETREKSGKRVACRARFQACEAFGELGRLAASVVTRSIEA